MEYITGINNQTHLDLFGGKLCIRETDPRANGKIEREAIPLISKLKTKVKHTPYVNSCEYSFTTTTDNQLVTTNWVLGGPRSLKATLEQKRTKL